MSSKEIDNLIQQLNKTLTSIDDGTVDIYKLTEVFNDHVDRIVRLEQRLTLLEDAVKNTQQIDSMPGAIQEF